MIPLRLTQEAYRIADSMPWIRPPILAQLPQPSGSSLATGIVFSKDRPMQLDALLRSYRNHVSGPAPLLVVYAASSNVFAEAYQEVVGIHAQDGCQFIREGISGTFQQILRDLLANISTPTVFFLVDDIVFLRRIDLQAFCSLASNECVPSMRLGRNISYSYTRQRHQRQPHLRAIRDSQSGNLSQKTQVGDHLLAWRWREGSIDWGYPLSLDGNVFQTSAIAQLVSGATFTSPNTLEADLQGSTSQFRRAWGVCFATSRIVNLPINRVQNDVDNLHGSVHQDDLLQQWLEGYALNIQSISGHVNVSVHEELHLPLKRRCV